jgi:hypothetical protein
MNGGPLRPWMYAWPGLAQIWLGRELDGLARSVVFAVFLNGAVLGTLVWSSSWPPRLVLALWVAAGAFWLGSVFETVWTYRRRGPGPAGELELREAIALCLRGEWNAARRALEKLLTGDPLDVDAAIWMVSVCRRQGDFGEARRWLRKLRRHDNAGKWQWELEEEARCLEGPA